MSRALAVCLLLLLWGHVAAQTWVAVSGASYHAERGRYKEFNPGLGIEHELSPTWRLIAGAYDNSADRETRYVGAAWLPVERGALKAGFVMALATGYSSRATTAILPAVAIEGRHVGVNVVVSPPVFNMPSVIGMQLKVRWR